MQRCEALCLFIFFSCTDVHKMFNSVNEYNLSENFQAAKA